MIEVHGWLLRIAALWSLALVLGWLIAAVRAHRGIDLVVAVSGLGTCVTAVLALLAILRREAAYLDGALALALLSFIAAVAAARFRRHGGVL